MSVIDLTHLLNENITVYPETEQPIFKQACTIEKNGFAEVKMTMYSHTGTHIDAPAHIIKDGITLDQFPPGYFIGKAICIDCRHFAKKNISKEYLKKFEREIQDVDFVLFRTNWSSKWNSKAYFTHYPTLSFNACKWLINFNLKGVGVDAISLDSIDSAELEVHQMILGKEMVIIENLTNLDKLGNEPFMFLCFPLKIINSDGSPIRAIAVDRVL